MLPFIPSWEKDSAHVYVRVDIRFILEEVEGYKNNFVFLRIPELSFQEVEE
jgi:hypothetical protein